MELFLPCLQKKELAGKNLLISKLTRKSQQPDVQHTPKRHVTALLRLLRVQIYDKILKQARKHQKFPKVLEVQRRA